MSEANNLMYKTVGLTLSSGTDVFLHGRGVAVFKIFYYFKVDVNNIFRNVYFHSGSQIDQFLYAFYIHISCLGSMFECESGYIAVSSYSSHRRYHCKLLESIPLYIV